MKLSKAEYEELIRKKPSLRPTEEEKPYMGFYEFNRETNKYEPAPHIAQEMIKSQNTHKTLIEDLEEGFKDPLDEFVPIPSLEHQNDHKGLIFNFSETFPDHRIRVTAIEEKPLKTPPEAIKSPKLLKFTIPGQPVGKPRQTRSDKWKKRPCVMRYRAWADKARASVPPGVSLGVYRQIAFIAYLEFPKSYSTTKRAWLTGQPHMLKPDVDNILKSFDALFPEDKFIWKVSGEKRWQDSGGARIEVELR